MGNAGIAGTVSMNSKATVAEGVRTHDRGSISNQMRWIELMGRLGELMDTQDGRLDPQDRQVKGFVDDIARFIEVSPATVMEVTAGDPDFMRGLIEGALQTVNR